VLWSATTEACVEVVAGVNTTAQEVLAAIQVSYIHMCVLFVYCIIQMYPLPKFQTPYYIIHMYSPICATLSVVTPLLLYSKQVTPQP
jgi:hypothetical protein